MTLGDVSEAALLRDGGIAGGDGAGDSRGRLRPGRQTFLREQIDGSAGLLPGSSNLPPDVDWPAYVAKLTALAERC